MVTTCGRAFHSRTSRFIAFLLVLSWGNFALAAEIHEAVKNNDLVKVKTLIKGNPDLVFSKDDDGFTPLHLAAANGYMEMAESCQQSRRPLQRQQRKYAPSPGGNSGGTKC